MNDIPDAVQLNLYVDDMEMHYSSTDLSCVEHDLQEDLNSVQFANCLSLSLT